jgi:hypothetical protein
VSSNTIAIPTVLLGCLTLVTACQSRPSECAQSTGREIAEANPAGLAPAHRVRFRSLVYSADFATRFHLPPKGIVSLGSGMQAVVLRISDDPAAAQCVVDVYLDDTADFAYPEGSEGRVDDMGRDADGALSFFSQSLADQDTQVALSQRWQAPRALIRSKDKNGVVEKFQVWPIASYYRHIVSDLNVVSLNVVCSTLLSDSGQVELWLLRANKDPAEMSAEISSEVAQRYEIPARLVMYAREPVKNAMEAQADLTHMSTNGTPKHDAYTIPD